MRMSEVLNPQTKRSSGELIDHAHEVENCQILSLTVLPFSQILTLTRIGLQNMPRIFLNTEELVLNNT